MSPAATTSTVIGYPAAGNDVIPKIKLKPISCCLLTTFLVLLWLPILTPLLFWTSSKPIYCSPDFKLRLLPPVAFPPRNENSTASFRPAVDFTLQNPSYRDGGYIIYYDNIIVSLFYKSLIVPDIYFTSPELTQGDGQRDIVNVSVPVPGEKLHEQYETGDVCDVDMASQFGLRFCRNFILSARFYMDIHVKDKNKELQKGYMRIVCKDLIKVLVSNSSSDSPIVLVDDIENSRKCHRESLSWHDYNECERNYDE